MSNLSYQSTQEFRELLAEVPEVSKRIHTPVLLEHAQLNKPDIKKSIRDLPRPTGKKAESAIVISAGPSVHRRQSIKRILDSGYQGTVIAADGAYIACLKAGLVPDYVLSVDPHRTRIVRWFGDPNFEKHSANDDYFARQDLDVEFRENSARQNRANIELVNTHSLRTKAIICAVSPRTVAQRVKEAGFDVYWWNPLVDSPQDPESLTRQLYAINKLPCINTGGNVGTTSWVFATTTLKIPRVALVGMDFGYYADLPFSQTQYYYELLNRVGPGVDLSRFFTRYKNPQTGEDYYADAPYAWYRNNFLELVGRTPSQTFNCTEGGTLFDENLKCIPLDEYFGMT